MLVFALYCDLSCKLFCHMSLNLFWDLSCYLSCDLHCDLSFDFWFFSGEMSCDLHLTYFSTCLTSCLRTGLGSLHRAPCQYYCLDIHTRNTYHTIQLKYSNIILKNNFSNLKEIYIFFSVWKLFVFLIYGRK